MSLISLEILHCKLCDLGHDPQQSTCRHLAAEGNHGLAVRRLLELGADKERRNKDKEFPMDLTTEKGIKKMLQVDA